MSLENKATKWLDKQARKYGAQVVEDAIGRWMEENPDAESVSMIGVDKILKMGEVMSLEPTYYYIFKDITTGKMNKPQRKNPHARSQSKLIYKTLAGAKKAIQLSNGEGYTNTHLEITKVRLQEVAI